MAKRIPPQHVSPQRRHSWLRFMEMKAFSRRCIELGWTDDELRALQFCLIAAPYGFPVIAGTGGIRKMRFARRADNRGKRDSFRVCYAYFPGANFIVLFTAYGKNEQDNIGADDKKAFKALMALIEKMLSERQVP